MAAPSAGSIIRANACIRLTSIRGMVRAADAVADAGQCSPAATLLRHAERRFARTQRALAAAGTSACLRSMTSLTRDMISSAQNNVAACGMRERGNISGARG